MSNDALRVGTERAKQAASISLNYLDDLARMESGLPRGTQVGHISVDQQINVISDVAATVMTMATILGGGKIHRICGIVDTFKKSLDNALITLGQVSSGGEIDSDLVKATVAAHLDKGYDA